MPAALGEVLQGRDELGHGEGFSPLYPASPGAGDGSLAG